uniref:Uncharacterized protein n=1 Tax=Arundo donax TaxID=35708 RepID=A0A0A9FJT6_ARUDO
MGINDEANSQCISIQKRTKCQIKIFIPSINHFTIKTIPTTPNIFHISVIAQK